MSPITAADFTTALRRENREKLGFSTIDMQKNVFKIKLYLKFLATITIKCLETEAALKRINNNYLKHRKKT